MHKISIHIIQLSFSPYNNRMKKDKLVIILIYIQYMSLKHHIDIDIFQYF